ncbi:suppressor of lurcher protein 1-like [Bacillus rossius redtenbacheri]|uniref:suppressor of lurcher protein 1-like n=1 Tax=Bacillus rossius redtenbacheri TaxID=93214 RepID=UPI002FDE5CE7
MRWRDVMEILIVVFFIEIMCIIFVEAVNPGCECHVFSSTYGKEHGVFSSPDYPQPYRDNISCLLYTFAANASDIVEISFKDFDVQKAPTGCLAGDFVRLYLHLQRPQVNERSPWSRVLCGGYSEVPHVHFSSGPAAVVEFHSDHRPGRAAGFAGRFRFLDRRMFQTDGQKVAGTACDHQFTSSNHSAAGGRFYSPRYPASYPRTTKCNYRFRGRLKERVRIVFEEVSLQNGDISCLNSADVIKVFAGRDEEEEAEDDGRRRVVAFLCNEAAGVEVLSTGQHLHVLFVANSQQPGRGFKAAYQFQPASGGFEEDNNHLERVSPHHRYSTDLGPAVSATTSSCDVALSSDARKNGSVASPLHPKPYPPGSYCQYDFQGRGAERVRVVFTHFDLYLAGGGDQCDSTDSLVAFSLVGGRKEKLRSFCGTQLPPPVMSSGPRLLLEFRGIYSSRYSTGFRAAYSFLADYGVTSGQQLAEFPCAFAFESNESLAGSFASPNYPGHYPRDTECHYFFHGAPQLVVRLHFDYFDVEGVPPCEAASASDYVEFSNYMGRDRRHQRHCGQRLAFDVRSDRNFFRVTLRSNDRLDGTGFHASYRFVDKHSPPATTPRLAGSSAPAGHIRAVNIMIIMTVTRLRW